MRVRRRWRCWRWFPQRVAPPTSRPPTGRARLERIAGSVVAIEIDQVRAFDTERNVSAQATGFIVDAELAG